MLVELSMKVVSAVDVLAMKQGLLFDSIVKLVALRPGAEGVMYRLSSRSDLGSTAMMHGYSRM
jgi:hypothetical protein